MLKVLIVDDEAPIRKWLAFCVEQIGSFTVVGTGKNGLQGIEMTQNCHPDIIITDIEMPGMSGTQMLKELKQKGMTPYVIVLTSHENFQYVRDSFQYGSAEYILKTEMNQDSLREALAKAKSVIMQRITDDENRSDESARKLIRSVLKEQALAGITYKTLRDREIYLENDLLIAIDIYSPDDLGPREIRALLAQDTSLYHVKYIGYAEGYTMLLANLHEGHSFHKLVERYDKIFKDIRGALGFSDIKSSVSELSDAIREAHARCSLAFYEVDRKIFWNHQPGIQKLPQMDHWRASFSKELFAQHFEIVISMKDQILQEIKEKKPTNLAEVKKLARFLTTTLLYFTLDTTDDLEKKVEEVGEKVESAATVDEMIGVIQQVYVPFQQRINKNKTYSETVQKIVSYIHTNYGDKITLASAAAYVSFSPEHTSRIFVKETGMNFVTYLNNVRMKHAVELLEQSNKRIYEIAEEVGYPSVSYFSTVFKKTFDVTPNEYQSRESF